MSPTVEQSSRALAALPGRALERPELLRVVETIAARRELWAPHMPPGGHERHYVSLHRDSHLDVWAIFWMPENDTGWHDLSSGAVRVVRGTLVEHALRIGGDDLQTLHRSGGAFAFGPSHIHRLTCREPGSGSIHAYSPPLWRLGQYGVSPDGVLHRQSVSYADELRPLQLSTGG